NTGNVSLAGPVSVTDDKITGANSVSCPNVNTVGNHDSFLDPGESRSEERRVAKEQDDLDKGSATNKDQGQAGGTKPNKASQTVTFTQTQALSLVKSATPPAIDAAGQTIAYSYLVTNTGNVSLAGPVTVGDDKIAAPNTVNCPNVDTVGDHDNFLDPGES